MSGPISRNSVHTTTISTTEDVQAQLENQMQVDDLEAQLENQMQVEDLEAQLENQIQPSVDPHYRILSLVSLGGSYLIAVLFIRFVTGQKQERPNTASMLILIEFLKMIMSLLLFSRSENFSDTKGQLASGKLFLLHGIPGGLYGIQNLFKFLAASFLPVAIFTAVGQSKLIFAAFFAFLILRTKFSIRQIASLLVLTSSLAGLFLITSKESGNNPNVDYPKGLTFLITMCLISGLAGTTMEKLMKSNTESISIWVRNAHLAVCGIISNSLFSIYTGDAYKIAQNGFFHNFDWAALVLVINESVGGLLVALVLKYADNIEKSLVVALVTIATFAISYYQGELELTLSVVTLSILSILSVVCYNVRK